MTDFQPTHKHKVTGEEFEKDDYKGRNIYVVDKHGEYRVFKGHMLEPLAPKEEWENVQNGCIRSDDGVIQVYIMRISSWVEYPHPDVRLLDGKILQRRKR